MRVMLLNPPGPYCRAGSRWPHKRPPTRTGIDYHPFPFGLAYAAARLREDGHDVDAIDCIASRVTPAKLKRRVRKFKPDVVFMETSAPSHFDDAEVMRGLGLPCIAGGAHATATIAEHLEAGYAGVICGEYDQVVSDAIALKKQPWLALPGDDAVEHAPLIKDLDSIPYPAWDLLPMDRYHDPICRGRSVTVLSTRGCTMRCEFCTLSGYHGARNYRFRDSKHVCDEIQLLIDKHHPDEIYFDDDSITLIRSHIMALCNEIKSRNWGLPFSCMGNCPVDREVLEAMAAAGCRAFKFGVESADPKVLRLIPKLMTPDDVLRTIKDCHELGIQTHATFLFGLPGETKESALKTIDFALGLGVHTLQFAIVTPYPGTELYARAKRRNWLVKDDWREFDPAGECVLSYPNYTAAEIVEVHDLAWRRWQQHMLKHQRGTIKHHFENAWRREGALGVARLSVHSLSRLAAMRKNAE